MVDLSGLEPPTSRLSGVRSNHLSYKSIQCEIQLLLRKEVIQPHLPIRLPCYDFTPVIDPTFDSCLLTVSSLASGISNSHGVTGGVYKTRERIHRGILIHDY